MFDTTLSMLYNIIFFPTTLINHNLSSTNVRLRGTLAYNVTQINHAHKCASNHVFSLSLFNQELYASDKLSAIIENCNGLVSKKDYAQNHV